MTDYELAFWGNCLDTLGEEIKHQVYAEHMGIPLGGDLQGRSVIDIGSGPVSMLLKCRGRGDCMAVDPLMNQFPTWVRQRYQAAGIAPWALKGEELHADGYDEAWIYNVLQHVDDPALVIANAREAAPVVRLFEWVGIPAYEGHPHELHPEQLAEWLGSEGHVIELAERGCHGTAFAGRFP